MVHTSWAEAARAVRGDGVRDQNFGSGACAAHSPAAFASVPTDGGEPSSGCWAVSFMQATAITPTRAATIACRGRPPSLPA